MNCLILVCYGSAMKFGKNFGNNKFGNDKQKFENLHPEMIVTVPYLQLVV